VATERRNDLRSSFVTTVQLKRYFAVFRGGKRWRLVAKIQLKSLVCFCCLGCASLLAQTEVTVAEPPEAEIVLTERECEELVAQLGAATFAERERAVGEILRIGMPLVPYLRKAIRDGGDAELLLRAKATLGQLTSSSFESKVAVFLSGQGDGIEFDGWQTVAATMGDSSATRDLFIQILRGHPGLITALDGTTRDRTVALNAAAQTVQTNFESHKFPTLADGVALLLPLADPGVTLSNSYEKTLITVMHTQMAGLAKDAFLWTPTSKLLNRWVSRSRAEPRSDVLWNAMQWGLSGARELGLRTLGESSDVATLQTAMQAIARFGTIEDAKAIDKFLDDKRIADSPDGIPSVDAGLRVTLGDTAIAAIAVIYEVPLKELGMDKAELHPKLGFLVENAGFLPSKPEDRTRAVQMVRGWIGGETPPGKPRS